MTQNGCWGYGKNLKNLQIVRKLRMKIHGRRISGGLFIVPVKGSTEHSAPFELTDLPLPQELIPFTRFQKS